MKITRLAAAAVAAAALAVTAAPASASADKVVGNTAAAPFVFKQTTGDCEEGAADAVLGAVTGSRLHEATIVKEAQKLGVMGANPALGSNWFGPSGITKLLTHYGLPNTVGSHSTATVETDLAAGDRLIAFVNAETLWAALDEAELVQAFGPPPAGTAWRTGTSAFAPSSTPDHAVALDAIDETTSAVLVSDTGMGLTYSVPLSTWTAAVATSGYSYAVVTPAH